jgi:hypothetical protein
MRNGVAITVRANAKSLGMEFRLQAESPACTAFRLKAGLHAAPTTTLHQP